MVDTSIFFNLGLMSILMREGFAYAHSFTPGIPVTLDATSSRARDRYMHLGFEVFPPILSGDEKLFV